MAIRLKPSVFTGRTGEEGDFSWMLKQPQYKKSLFIFNDNVSQSQAFLKQWQAGAVDQSSSACSPGAGNGAIRPAQCESPPRAIGIPTGPGFASLADGKQDIDKALSAVGTLLATGNYDQAIYSASKHDPNILGSGTFDVPDDVLKYIPSELKKVVAAANA